MSAEKSQSVLNSTNWRPAISAGIFRQRADLLAAARHFFKMEGYLEVETPLLSHDTVVDRNLDPLRVAFQTHRGAAPEWLFLQTSPEFGMKRLLASGMTSIFQIGKAYRGGEVGRHHNPEFTMFEWYRTGNDHHAQITCTEALFRTMSQSVNCAIAESAFPRLTYDAAFERAIGCRVLKLSASELVSLCEQQNLVLPDSLNLNDRDGLLNLLLAEKVEPTLGVEQPEFVFDYPASQAALAKVREDDPPVAERFELYWNGIELCNGYHELTDAAVLQSRIESENRQRVADGADPLPVHNYLLDAMRVDAIQAGLPACAGVALGFDRLAMLLLGKETLAEVIPFPFDRA